MTKRYAVGFDPQDVPEGYEVVPVDALTELPSDALHIVINDALSEADILFETAVQTYWKARVLRATADTWRELRAPDPRDARPTLVHAYIRRSKSGTVTVSFYDDGNAEIRVEREDGSTLGWITSARDAWNSVAAYGPPEKFESAPDEIIEEGE